VWSCERARVRLATFVGGIVAVVALAAPAAIAADVRSDAKACGVTVKVADNARYVVNRYFMDAMRFVPGTVTVKSGCDLTFEFAMPDDNDPHSLSLIKAADVPRTNEQMEKCKVCKQIKTDHVRDPTEPAGPHNPIVHWIVNVGKPGLDVPGDSLSIFESKSKGAPPGHSSVTVPVSAAPGSILHYICGMHPWMQGKIVVT
jgi:plastocyanin